jgi:ketosteroid isomerase-like protein
MRMQFGTFFFFFVCTLTARNAQAQQLVPGVLTLHAEEVAWQESVGWEMAGKHLDVGYCMVFEFKDGRIIHGRENFLDLYTWDEFWS